MRVYDGKACRRSNRRFERRAARFKNLSPALSRKKVRCNDTGLRQRYLNSYRR